jgi:hypothetical protein
MKGSTAPASSPSPEPRQKAAVNAEQDLNKEFELWQRDYEEWLKGAARIYNGSSQ